MDRFSVDQDNVSSQRSQAGRSLHTYTPRSHEDLLRSHLQLDAERNKRLQNDVQRLTLENERLRRELGIASKDLKDRLDEINTLNKLKIPKTPPPTQPQDERPWNPNTVFQVDGKPVTLDELISHFNGVIQRHHDLINEKNKQIQDLQDALDKLRNETQQRREVESRLLKPRSDEALQQSILNEFTNQLGKIRKEYEQVEFILTERNEKLERLIEDLQQKLDQYAKEIQYLRNELSSQLNIQPNEATMQLLREKEKENNYLKEIISSLKNQRQNVQDPQITNKDLENEIKKVIDSKNGQIYELNNLISGLKTKQNELNEPANSDLFEFERDCKTIILDLNNLNEKFNSMFQRLKESPTATQDSTVDKNNLMSNLEKLKKQIEDEMKALKNKISSSGSTPDAVILRGQAVVRIDDPKYLKKQPLMPSSENEVETVVLSEEPIETSSNIQFTLYPTAQYVSPMEGKQRPHDVLPDQPQRTLEYRSPSSQVSFQKPEPLSKAKYYPIIPCEACSVTEIPFDRNLKYTPQPSYQSIPPVKQKTPPQQKKLIQKFYSFTKERDKIKTKPKSKRGCCGNQASETSNIPYDKYPEKEKLVHIYNPSENPQKLDPPSFGTKFQTLSPISKKNQIHHTI